MRILIDGKECSADKGECILDVARRNGIRIPALCHSDALPGQGNCRLCIVEIVENNKSRIVASCIYPINNEIEVITHSDKIMNMRRTMIMLLAARSPENEIIKNLQKEYSVPSLNRFTADVDENCILCGLCVRACEEVGPCAISTVNRGVAKKISTPYDEPSTVCIGCGACAHVCPTGAIKINGKEGRRTIWNRTFELVKCSKCGEYFITQEQIEYISKKLNTKEDSLLCDKCKKKVIVEKLRDIYENATVK